ncbi:MAG: sensor histidine kinase [Verrucomicrobia bacterium]|nr:sensor histidine kinase [Verrucomicrobiota bacterium]
MATVAPAQRKRGRIYGTLAYGSVVLSCYAGFFNAPRYYTSEWMVITVFTLGAIYAVLGIFGAACVDGRGRAALGAYFAVQCAILTAIIFLSPIRGFIGIIVLPVVSQAVFDLRARTALLIGLYLFGINIAIWAIPYGWDGMKDALISYSTAFAFTVAFTIITKQALNSHAREEKLRQETEAANALLRANAAQADELATTRERNRVAREIHDGVGHYLTVVKTQLDAALALMPTQPERARDTVEKAARLASEALEDVRRSVGTLRTETPPASLVDRLRALVREAGEGAVTLRVEGAARPLAPGVEHALFRAAQEGLTNVRKHAGDAAQAEVVLHFRENGRVTLAVTDNGRGPAGAKSAAGGYGLVGIRERIEVLGGRVAAGNAAGAGGFALTIEVPA